MRKLFTILAWVVALILILPASAIAKDYFEVWKVVTDDGGSTQVKLLGWECADATCSSMNFNNPVLFYKGEAWNACVLKYYYDKDLLESCLSSYKVSIVNTNEPIVVRYQNVPNVKSKKYATYYFGKDYIGYADVARPYCESSYQHFACGDPTNNNPSNPYIATLIKKDGGIAEIQKLEVTNINDVNLPLEIGVPASISNEVCSAFKKTNIVGYYPPEDGVYIDYSVDTQLVLEVRDASGNLVYTDSLQTSVPADECAFQDKFTWTPDATGKYTIKVISKIVDSQIRNPVDDYESTTTYVRDPSSSYCYTRIQNLAVTDEHGDYEIVEGEAIKVAFNYLSALYIDESTVIPVDTKLTITLVDSSTGSAAYSTTFTSSAPQTLTYKSYEDVIGAYPPASYTLRVEGVASSSMCDGLSNEVEVQEANVNVLKKTHTVTFTVYDDETKSPLENAQIRLWDDVGNYDKTLYTGSDGKATFTSVPEGEYHYEASKSGYHTESDVLSVNTDITKVIYLRKVNIPPVVDFSSIDQPVSVDVGTAYTINLKNYIYDPDDAFDSLSIQATPSKSFVTVTINNGAATITASQEGSATVTFTATDPDGASASDSISFTFVQNDPPVIVDKTAGSDYSIYVGESMAFFVKATDPDGDPLTFIWRVDGAESKRETLSSTATSSFLFEGSSAGLYTIEVKVTDGKSSVSASWKVTVLEKPKNTAPVAIILTNGEDVNSVTVEPGTTLTFDGSPSYDPDGDPITYRWDTDGDGVADSTAQSIQLTFSEEGSYTIELVVADDKGLEGKDTVVVNIVVTDTTPPTTTISPNGHSWTNEDVGFTLTCVDDYSGCSATYYTIINNDQTCPSSGYTSGQSGTVTCADGSVCIKKVCFYSVDNEGNKESVKESNPFYIDKKAPTGSVTHSPQNPTDEDAVTISTTASDDGSGIDKIEIYVDGNLATTCTSTTSCSYNAGSFPAGTTITYYAKIYDKAGNTFTTPEGSFTVRESEGEDTTPPTTTISPNGHDWTNQNVSFTLTCNDDKSGCQNTYYKVVDNTAECGTTGYTSGQSGTVTCSTGNVCIKKVCYYSVDVAGNTESIKESNPFYIDKAIPSGSITHSPQNPTDVDEVSFTAQASDEGSGIEKIEIYVNGTLEKTCDDVADCSYTSGPYSAGTTITYYAKIYDKAGNTFTTPEGSFTVRESEGEDTTPPTTTITLNPPAPNGNNGWYTTSVSFNLTCTDDSSGCNATYFCVDTINTCNPENVFQQEQLINESNVWYVRFYSVDNAGNVEEIKSVEIKIDMESPLFEAIQHSPQEPEEGEQLTISANATDNLSGVERIELYVNDALKSTCNSSSCTFTITTPSTLVYYLVAYDNAGNSFTSERIEVNVIKKPSGGGGGGGGGTYYVAPPTIKEETPEVENVVIDDFIQLPYVVNVEATPNAEMDVYVDGNIYTTITTDKNGFATFTLVGLEPGQHLLEIKHEGKTLYSKVFVVEGLPSSITIHNLKDGELVLYYMEENEVMVSFAEGGNYTISITGPEWMSIEDSFTLGDGETYSFVVVPEEEGTFTTRWKLFRDGVPYASFTIDVKVVSSPSTIVEELLSKEKLPPSGITGLAWLKSTRGALLFLLLAALLLFFLLAKRRKKEGEDTG